MKSLFVFIIISTSISLSQVKKIDVNLKSDNEINQITIFESDQNIIVKMNNSHIKLIGGPLAKIISTEGEIQKKDIEIADINNDGIKEILIAVEHPIFANKFFLYIIAFKDTTLTDMNFYLNQNDSTNKIVVDDGICVFDSKRKSLYIKTGQVSYNASNGETVFLSKVNLFQWNKEIGLIINKGEKYFLKISNYSLSKIIF